MTTPIKWIIGILTPIVLVLCLLSFGDPQWGKWIYITQAYYSPFKFDELPLPKRYQKSNICGVCGGLIVYLDRDENYSVLYNAWCKNGHKFEADWSKLP